MMPNIIVTSRKFLGAVVILSLFTSACAEQQQQATGPRAIPVKLETIQSSTLIDSTQYVGYLESRQRAALAPRIQGQIIKIFVEEGDAVNVGQPIAELEPTREEEQVFPPPPMFKTELPLLTKLKLNSDKDKRNEMARNLKLPVLKPMWLGHNQTLEVEKQRCNGL